jgi:hypothetical protein
MRLLEGATLPVPDDADGMVGGIADIEGEVFAVMVMGRDHIATLMSVVEVALENMDKQSTSGLSREDRAIWRDLRRRLLMLHTATQGIALRWEERGNVKPAVADYHVETFGNLTKVPRTRRGDIN